MDRIARAMQSTSTFFVACALGCGSNPAKPHDAGTKSASSSASSAAAVYVGDVADSDARVALIATKHHVRAYFCGGDSSYMQLSHWLSADLVSEHAEIKPQNAGDWALELALGGASDASGKVTAADGTSHEFTATLARAQDGTLNGVFESDAECGKLGLIVVQKKPSTPATGQGACIGDDLVTVEQVNPVLPVSLDADGSVRVMLRGENDVYALRPATPPAE